MTASGFRVGVTGLVFVFNLASLALKQVSNCIQKPKTNTFGKLIKFLYQLLHGLFLVVLDGFRSFQMVSGRFRWFQVVLGYFQVVLDRFRSFQLVPHFSEYPHQVEYKPRLVSKEVNTNIFGAKRVVIEIFKSYFQNTKQPNIKQTKSVFIKCYKEKF